MTARAALRPVPLADTFEAFVIGDKGQTYPLNSAGPLDRMIAIQCEAYPSDWSDADKREMAEIHLFGRNDRG